MLAFILDLTFFYEKKTKKLYFIHEIFQVVLVFSVLELFFQDWSNLDKALQAQEMATECLKYRKKQEKEDRLLAQKLVLEELKAAGPNS